MSAGHGYKTTTYRTTSPGGTAEPLGFLSADQKTPNACTHVGWTEERIGLLTHLWKDGFSGSQIAKKLGGVTRNAVIGKVHRLGLMGRATPAAPRRTHYYPPRGGAGAVKAARERAAKPIPLPKIGGPSQPNPVENRVATIIANAEARENPAENVLQMARAFAPLPGREPVPFGSKGCKWPVGGEGADMLACGCERDGESPYCADHHKASVQPVQPKDNSGPKLARSLRRWAA